MWKVARYTCSSPLYFGEYDNYVDTSVVCKNLCGIGLEKINLYYSGLQQTTPDPISVVVSLGDGILSPQQLGTADSTAAYYLSLSGQARLNNPKELLRVFQNVVALYSSAAVSLNFVQQLLIDCHYYTQYLRPIFTDVTELAQLCKIN